MTTSENTSANNQIITMKWIIALTIGIAIGLIINTETLRSPSASIAPAPAKPLEKYSFPNLRSQKISPLPIELVEPIATESGYTSWLFRYQTEQGWIGGQINLPEISAKGRSASGGKTESEKFPTIVMIRGYVDKEEYQTGVGTKNAAAVFAQNGFVTVAPDFLGYGSSDPEPENELESRFLRPQAILQLLASIPGFSSVDPEKVFIWAHSNGGQIALSVLEISGRPIPITLWAPVSKPFPYSILYYTDDLNDHGKYLRRLVADFESLYDAQEFSITNYFDQITAPIQIHQGTADDSVPWQWSIQLTKELQKRKLDVSLYQYPGADHNFHPAWATAIARDLNFFKSHLK